MVFKAFIICLKSQTKNSTEKQFEKVDNEMNENYKTSEPEARTEPAGETVNHKTEKYCNDL